MLVEVVNWAVSCMANKEEPFERGEEGGNSTEVRRIQS
jgi:hypothetical protein